MLPGANPPAPRLTVRQRWLAARRLAAGDTPRVAAAFAGAEVEDLEDLAATDPRFMALLDDAKALRALSREQWRERVEGLLRDHVEDAIAEGRVTTINLGLKGLRLLEDEPEDYDPDAEAEGLLAKLTPEKRDEYDCWGARDELVRRGYTVVPPPSGEDYGTFGKGLSRSDVVTPMRRRAEPAEGDCGRVEGAGASPSPRPSPTVGGRGGDHATPAAHAPSPVAPAMGEGWGEGAPDRLAALSIMARGSLAADGALAADLDGVRLAAAWVRTGDDITVFDEAGGHRLSLVDPLADTAAEESSGGRVTAPMPGKVAAVLVEPGALVERGQPLLVLEAMKMEHTICAPEAGRIAAVRYAAGEQVEDGALLVELAAKESPP